MKKLTLLFIYVSAVACAADPLPAVKDGDLIFQSSLSSQSAAVQRATGSVFSHMGIVLMRSGKPFVFEAGGRVRYTPLAQWIEGGKDGRYVVRRLKDAPALLTPTALLKLHALAGHFEGRPYDLAFGWSDDRIYCSELVWKLYDKALHLQIGKLQRMKEFNLDDAVVREKLRERYGAKVPLEEPVISPVAVFESPLLVTVMER